MTANCLRYRRRRVVGPTNCLSVILVVLCLGCGRTVDTPRTDSTDRSSAAGAPEVADVSTPTEAAQSDAPTATPPTAAPAGTSDRGAMLYAQHCAGCHGENGDGRGRAMTFVFPRPRDFRAGRFRLISSTNGVPTREDLEAVLVRGMPGSAMISWAHLPAKDRSLLADQVMKFRRDGAADVERALAEEAGEELAEEDLADNVARVTTPSDPFVPPAIGESTTEAISRGKETYLAKGCAACHGAGGKGDGQQQMVDAEGLATRPRDLTLGIFKGPHDPASIYRRLWLGMPGSPMPASQQLSPEQVTDLVHFVLSLSTEPQREAAVMRRASLRALKVSATPKDMQDAVWNDVPAQQMVATPLWWRDEPDRDLHVQAAHDGQSLVLRVRWRDATASESAVRPDEFEDMVAVELYQGNAEPFLGMGAPGAAIDLWHWRAGTKHDGSEDQLSDEYPFDTAIYRELFPGKNLPDFVTARVVGNPLALRERDGANLRATGHGSVTFLPPASQVVEAQGHWENGYWTVTLRRALDVPVADGLPLRVGERFSLAVALWDGAARDRAGQKLVTLWNDLQLD